MLKISIAAAILMVGAAAQATIVPTTVKEINVSVSRRSDREDYVLNPWL
jgi:hypothetical protein